MYTYTYIHIHIYIYIYAADVLLLLLWWLISILLSLLIIITIVISMSSSSSSRSSSSSSSIIRLCLVARPRAPCRRRRSRSDPEVQIRAVLTSAICEISNWGSQNPRTIAWFRFNMPSHSQFRRIRAYTETRMAITETSIRSLSFADCNLIWYHTTYDIRHIAYICS